MKSTNRLIRQKLVDIDVNLEQYKIILPSFTREGSSRKIFFFLTAFIILYKHYLNKFIVLAFEWAKKKTLGLIRNFS